MDIVERLRAMTSSEGQRAITLARVAQLSLVHGWDNVPDAADEDTLRHWLRQMIAFAVEEQRVDLGAAAVACARAFGLHVQTPQAYPGASDELKRAIWGA